MLKIKDLVFQVSDEDRTLGILQGITLTIPDNKFVVITGPNGGGKTTLAKAIMGIVQPTGGQILWNGTDVTGMSVTERARLGISYGGPSPSSPRPSAPSTTPGTPPWWSSPTRSGSSIWRTRSSWSPAAKSQSRGPRTRFSLKSWPTPSPGAVI